MTFEEIQKRVLFWADERDILAHSTPQAQCLKLIEELGELAAGIARGDRALIADALGDLCVIETIIAHMYGTDLTACLGGAYIEIKDRKGRLSPEGVFIKEEPAVTPTFTLAEGASPVETPAYSMAEGAGHD
jgi:NTP pyrophosphatase (non-canonical NTP hydrolase)